MKDLEDRARATMYPMPYDKAIKWNPVMRHNATFGVHRRDPGTGYLRIPTLGFSFLCDWVERTSMNACAADANNIIARHLLDLGLRFVAGCDNIHHRACG